MRKTLRSPRKTQTRFAFACEQNFSNCFTANEQEFELSESNFLAIASYIVKLTSVCFDSAARG